MHRQTAKWKDTKTLISRIQLYIADNKATWDIFVQPVPYAYNSQVHHSTAKMLSFEVLTRHLSRPTTIDRPTALLPDDDNATKYRCSTGTYTGTVGHYTHESQWNSGTITSTL